MSPTQVMESAKQNWPSILSGLAAVIAVVVSVITSINSNADATASMRHDVMELKQWRERSDPELQKMGRDVSEIKTDVRWIKDALNRRP